MMQEAQPNLSLMASRYQASQNIGARLVAALIFTTSLGLLVLAFWLQPSGKGVGTHEELGLPPCGFLSSTGIPCATCGMTTSFSLAAHGRIIESLVNQPAGGALAILTAMAVVGSGFTLITGASMWPIISGMVNTTTIIFAGVFFGLAWVYKIAMVLAFVPLA